MTGCACHTRIRRHERRAECLRERDISGVVGRQVVAQFPDPPGKNLVLVVTDIEFRKKPDRGGGGLGRSAVFPLAAADDLKNLHDTQLWSVDAEHGVGEPSTDLPGERQIEQELHDCGRIKDDHRASRSARTDSAAVSPS